MQIKNVHQFTNISKNQKSCVQEILHFRKMKVSIGEKIKQVLEERKLPITEFAKRINTSRNNIYSIFSRDTIDTGLLGEISTVLDFDFFEFYSENSKFAKEKEKEIKAQTNKELEDCQQALKFYLEKISYLERINKLQEDNLKMMKQLAGKK